MADAINFAKAALAWALPWDADVRGEFPAVVELQVREARRVR
jgi:hypothetical protein